MVEAPSTSKDDLLQDRFNQQVAEVIKQLLAEIEELKARVATLEP